MSIDDELIREGVQSAVNRGGPGPDLWARIQPHLPVQKSRTTLIRRRWLQGVVAAACLLALLVVPGLLRKPDVVQAMEQAVAQMPSYHGVLEVSVSGPGVQRTDESMRIFVWADGERRVVQRNRGVPWEYNNGDRIWLVWPENKQANVQVATSDFAAGTVDLQMLVRWTRQYPHQVVGEESILGRPATKLVGTYPNGLRFTIWIDEKSSLPLQVEQERGKGIVETSKYLALAENTVIDPQFFSYTPPEGWRVERQREGTVVGTVGEAAQLAGFTPLTIKAAPRRIVVLNGEATLDYGGGNVVTQERHDGPLDPCGINDCTLGSAAGGPMLQGPNSLAWVQNGIKVYVYGDDCLRIARELAPDLQLADPAEDYAANAQVKVGVDPAEARRIQAAADQGEDTLNGRMEDLVLDYVKPDRTRPWWEWMGSTVAGNGAQAVVEMPSGPYLRIYLKRVVRQDISGAWFIVGYDPR